MRLAYTTGAVLTSGRGYPELRRADEETVLQAVYLIPTVRELETSVHLRSSLSLLFLSLRSVQAGKVSNSEVGSETPWPARDT